MNFISRYLIERRRKKSGLNFTKDDVLKSRPVRNSLIKWDTSDSGAISLVIPQKKAIWVTVISKLFMLPGSRVVILDEVGSFVWTLCDGHNTIDTIIRALCNKYKLTRKEAETSLLEYFRRLGKRGIVGFAVVNKAQDSVTKVQD